MEEKPYLDQLDEKLKAARNRLRKGEEVKNLKAGAPTLFEIIDGEISLEINKGYDDRAPLTYNDYLESHGAVRGIRRIRNLLDSREVEAPQAQAEVTAIENNIKQIKDDQKQK